MGEAPNTVDDAIDALGGTPTTEEVFLGTRAFSARRLAASAVRRVLGGGGGGGSVPVEWAGPLNITATTLPANGDYLHLTDLAAGQILYDAYAVINADFANGVTIGLAVSKRGDPNVSAQFGSGAFVANQNAGSAIGYYDVALRSGSAQAAPFVILGNCELVAYLDGGVLGPNGNLDVFALIGTPT